MKNETTLRDIVKKYKDCFRNEVDSEVLNIIGRDGNHIVAVEQYENGKPLILITEGCYNELQMKFGMFDKSFAEIEDIEKEILSCL